MEKLKQYKYIIGIVIVLVAGFYWYDIRPSNIRKECNNSAFIESMKYTPFNDVNVDEISARMTLKDKLYKDCLRYSGISI